MWLMFGLLFFEKKLSGFCEGIFGRKKTGQFGRLVDFWGVTRRMMTRTLFREPPTALCVAGSLDAPHRTRLY